MRFSYGLVIATLALAGTAQVAGAQTAQQFDLHCTGHIWPYLSGADPNDGERPWTGTVKVDLASGRFCDDGCREPRAIESVAPNFIVLHQGHFGRVANDTSSKLDRVSGTYEWQKEYDLPGPIHAEHVIATCRPAPFTGLPGTAF